MGFFAYDRNEYYDVLRGVRASDRQVSMYGQLAKQDQQIQENLEKYAETYPEYPAHIAASMAIAGVPVEYDAHKEIVQELSNNRIYNEAKIWKELQDKYSYEHTEDNMKMTVWDLFTAGLHQAVLNQEMSNMVFGYLLD